MADGFLSLAAVGVLLTLKNCEYLNVQPGAGEVLRFRRESVRNGQ